MADSKKKRKYYINRELSWLQFNERVLEEAADGNPLMERFSFLSIVESNLMEFFMVRVGPITDEKILGNKDVDKETHKKPAKVLEDIQESTRELLKKETKVYKNLRRDLKKEHVEILKPGALGKREKAYFRNIFKERILPVLSVVTMHKGDQFFFENDKVYFLTEFKEKKSRALGIVSCKEGVLPPYFVYTSDPFRLFLTEDIIKTFLPDIFPEKKMRFQTEIKIIRNADIDPRELIDEGFDYRDKIHKLIKKRGLANPIAAFIRGSENAHIRETVSDILSIKKGSQFFVHRPLSFSFIPTLRKEMYTRKSLFYEPFKEAKSPYFPAGKSLISSILDHDALLMYPYEYTSATVDLLEEAAVDPRVTKIEMTLYRLSNHSRVVAALAKASRNGKKVIVLMELKARFDEENNIHWSEELEEAGCEVHYGVGTYKVHSKLLLITVKDGESLRHVTEISTGNFNETTARIYTDLAYFTSRADISLEVSDIMAALWQGILPTAKKKILVSPVSLRDEVIHHINREIEIALSGKKAYIGVKINALTDKAIMKRLIKASKAGVEIELLIRGINCLKVGIPEKTDNIRVSSVVGRFLEHARIYIFGTKEREEIYISSADFMTRNTLRRVEVAVPIEDPMLKTRVRRIFDFQMKDNIKRRIQLPDGRYIRKERDELSAEIDSQEIFARNFFLNS